MFSTEQQYQYDLMRSVDVYYKFHTICYGCLSSVCFITLPGGSTTDALRYFWDNINLVDIWLQMLDKKYI